MLQFIFYNYTLQNMMIPVLVFLAKMAECALNHMEIFITSVCVPMTTPV